MGSKRDDYLTLLHLKLNYAEKRGNWAPESCFGSPPTEKMIREWRKQRKDLIKADVALAMH
jgi:hypothetical protein